MRPILFALVLAFLSLPALAADSTGPITLELHAGDGRWLAVSRDGAPLCKLSCTRKIRFVSDLHLESDADRSEDALRLDLPPSLEAGRYSVTPVSRWSLARRIGIGLAIGGSVLLAPLIVVALVAGGYAVIAAGVLGAAYVAVLAASGITAAAGETRWELEIARLPEPPRDPSEPDCPTKAGPSEAVPGA